MSTTFRLLGPEVSISSANDVSSARRLRIYNSGATAVLTVQYANGTAYANTTVPNTSPIVIEKSPTDKVVGANMLATPIATR
jgi:hypothetical protein